MHRLPLALLCLILLADCKEPSLGTTEAEVQAQGTPTGGPLAEVSEEEAEPEPIGPPKRLFARRFVVKVRSRASREAPRIGYLRGGAVMQATTGEPVGHEGCRGGWFELTTGGFVCSVRDVIAFLGDRLPEARATQADREALLPYRYGYARRDNTPVFRRIPTQEEAVDLEGYVVPGSETPDVSPTEADANANANANAEADTNADAQEKTDATGPTDAPPDLKDDPSAMPAGLAGAGSEPDPGSAVPLPATAEPETAAREDEVEVAATSGSGESPGEGEAEEEPSGPPTLESLRAEDDGDGVLLRRMMRGFYVSLDRDFRSGGRRYWRTQQNEYIPYAALGFKSGSTFAGVELSDAQQLPIGYVVSRRTRYYGRRGEDRAVARRPAGYHHQFPVQGDVTLRNVEYWQGDDERLYRKRDVVVIEAKSRPEEVPAGSKWLDINLGEQTLVAYEDEQPVFATLMSSGIIRREDIPEQNHATPTGIFRVKAKHLTTTMDGDNAFDGPYSIQDVAYVMYYEQGYATHAAFWHNLFGHPKSHGCINLSPGDAAWVFNWADPQLPEGWHGVYPTQTAPGTFIVVHGETPR